MWKTCLPAIVLLAFLAAASLVARADQPELLNNPGFESGDTSGWISVDGDLSVASIANSGNWGAQLVSDGVTRVAETGQFIDVTSVGTYRMSAWLLFNDPNLDHATLQVLWFDAGDHYLGSEGSNPLYSDAVEPGIYRHLQTGNMVAPITAARAHATISVWGVNNGAFTIYIDDASLVLVAAPPPPTPTAPASATDPPSPGSGTNTATPTVTRTPTPAPHPTPTPVRPPITPGPEPSVFGSLTNGGFEQRGQDGAPFGWRKIGGTMTQVEGRGRGDSHALSLTSATSSTKWAYQTIGVQGGAYYRASAFAKQDNAQPGETFLRVSWYESADGNGEAISNDDSTSTLDSNTQAYRQLSTDAIQAPANAASARVRLMLRPASDAATTAIFDDISFIIVPAPTDAPATPSPTPTPTVTQTAPPPTDGTTATRTPTATRTRTPSPTPSSHTGTPTPGPAEPDTFTSLVNGGFEEAREDGTPYGWHKSGGSFAVTPANRTEGELGLEIDSDTSSTKWVYEAITVTPGATYLATAWALNSAPADELLLRVSWYSSDNGDGSIIESVDSSGTVSGPVAGFRLLDTGVVLAPADAHSARIRLLLRPASSTATRAFFDDAGFGPASASGSPQTVTGGGSPSHVGGATTVASPGSSPRATALGAAATPVSLTNAGPNVRNQPAATGSSGGGSDWLIWLALILPTGGIAAVLAAPYLRRSGDDAGDV